MNIEKIQTCFKGKTVWMLWFFGGRISTTTVPQTRPGMKFISVGEVVVSSLPKTFWSDSTVRSHLFLVRNKSTPSWFLISHHVSHYQFEKLCKKGIVLQRKHPTCDHEVMDCIELRRHPQSRLTYLVKKIIIDFEDPKFWDTPTDGKIQKPNPNPIFLFTRFGLLGSCLVLCVVTHTTSKAGGWWSSRWINFPWLVDL